MDSYNNKSKSKDDYLPSVNKNLNKSASIKIVKIKNSPNKSEQISKNYINTNINHNCGLKKTCKNQSLPTKSSRIHKVLILRKPSNQRFQSHRTVNSNQLSNPTCTKLHHETMPKFRRNYPSVQFDNSNNIINYNKNIIHNNKGQSSPPKIKITSTFRDSVCYRINHSKNATDIPSFFPRLFEHPESVYLKENEEKSKIRKNRNKVSLYLEKENFLRNSKERNITTKFNIQEILKNKENKMLNYLNNNPESPYSNKWTNCYLSNNFGKKLFVSGFAQGTPKYKIIDNKKGSSNSSSTNCKTNTNCYKASSNKSKTCRSKGKYSKTTEDLNGKIMKDINLKYEKLFYFKPYFPSLKKEKSSLCMKPGYSLYYGLVNYVKNNFKE